MGARPRTCATRAEVSLAVGVPTARPSEPGTMVSMTEPDPRAAFAAMTKALITDFRANGGRVTSGPFAGRPVLLLTTTGAKSGQPRLAPVVY